VKAVVEIYNFCKQFGPIKALKNLSLIIAEGENFCLFYFAS